MRDVFPDCYHCGAEFEVVLSENWDNLEIKYCPYCGTELDIELDFEDD